MSKAASEGGRAFESGRAASWARENGVYVAFAAIILFNVVFTTNFATTATMFNLLVQTVPVLLVSLGMALVIGTEGIDLSVGSVMALAAAVLPLYLGYGWPVAIAITLATGVVAGLVSGGLVSFVGVQPIVATLALLVGLRGLAQLMVGGQLISIRDPFVLSLGRGEILGIPVPVIIAVSAALIVAFLVSRTTFGRYLLSIGGNRAASKLSGHPVKRTLVTVYVISGLLAAVAGIVVSARLGASDPSNIGVLIELSAIAAVVVGGTPLTGGKVRIFGTVVGALLMQLISATFIMNNLPYTYAQVLTALIILLAVYLQKGRGTS